MANNNNNDSSLNTSIEAVIELSILLNMVRDPKMPLLPDSPFLNFCKKETHSPASNMFWLKKDDYSFMFTVDGLMGKETWEPGVAISYGHRDRDQGSFGILNSSGILKTDPVQTMKKVMDGSKGYSEDNLNAYSSCIDALAEMQMKYSTAQQ